MLQLLPLAVVAVAYWVPYRRRAQHLAARGRPVPTWRQASFLGGLAVLLGALSPPMDDLSDSLFSVHMVQHLLLTLLAAPLIVLGAPITLVLRASTPHVRHRVILPILHSRVMRAVTFPVVTWVLFAATMWWTHFSPIFNASLENGAIHDLEHALYLTVGLLFWWPAIGLDPSPWRMSHPVRAMYVFLQMPQNTFLAVTILNSAVVLYAHYATLVRPWGPTALEDQQLAGAIMWICGDVLFITSMFLILFGWAAFEKRHEAEVDRRVDAERAAIRQRETTLAERLASERLAGESLAADPEGRS
jgi:putative membrane protein